MNVPGTSPLLAFEFASPWLLAGLALAAIPTLLHLWQRRQYRETRWAAMRFLIDATRRHSRRIRLEQLLLLIVRTLIVLLVVLGLARPLIESLASSATREEPVHRIIVLDTSYSMQYEEQGVPRYEKARAAARRIAEAAEQGDALNLLRIAGLQPPVVVGRPTFRATNLTDELDRLPCSNERGDLMRTLDELETVLEAAPEIPRKHVYLVSDFQSAMWAPRGGSLGARIRERLKELSRRAKIVLIDVADEEASNAAVTSIEQTDSIVTPGQSVVFSVGLQNFGKTPLQNRRVELYVDSRLVDTQRVHLPPHTDVTVDLTHTFSAGGDRRVEVRLQDDALPLDNRRWMTVSVHGQIDVLLVNGRPAGRATEQATHYLQIALAPETARRPWQGALRPYVINESELAGTDLGRYACVFLCDVGLVTPREVGLLKTYVASGGALIVCLGEQVNLDNYNRLLFDEDDPLLPARLVEHKGDAQDKSQAFSFDPGDYDHPLLDEFKGNPGTGLENTIIYKYVATEVPEEGQARVALRYDTGDAAIVEAPYGAGRTALITTSVDEQWGAWAVWAPSFVPLVHELTLLAAAQSGAERNLLVGEPIARRLPANAFDIEAALATPHAGKQTLPVLHGDDLLSVQYDETDAPGIYALTLGPPLGRTELFAANVDAREGRLESLGSDEIDSVLLPNVDYSFRSRFGDYRAESTRREADMGRLARWCLTAALCLLFVEQLMAWRFFAGFVLLYVLIAAALVAETLRFGVPAAVVTAVLLVALLGLLTARRLGLAGLPRRRKS